MAASAVSAANHDGTEEGRWLTLDESQKDEPTGNRHLPNSYLYLLLQGQLFVLNVPDIDSVTTC
jgi:hypothetical protein